MVSSASSSRKRTRRVISREDKNPTTRFSSSSCETMPHEKLTLREIMEAVESAHPSSSSSSSLPHSTSFETAHRPPPPSLLSYLAHIAREKVGFDDDDAGDEMEDSGIGTQPRNEIMQDALDLSALVATGVAVEESLTAILLPLAHAHVARTRAMAADSAANEECMNEQLVLPPAEALSILADPSKTPDRFRRIGYLPSMTMSGETDDHFVSREEREDDLESWCKARDLEPNLFRQNPALLSLFESTPPMDT